MSSISTVRIMATRVPVRMMATPVRLSSRRPEFTKSSSSTLRGPVVTPIPVRMVVTPVSLSLRRPEFTKCSISTVILIVTPVRLRVKVRVRLRLGRPETAEFTKMPNSALRVIGSPMPVRLRI
uniref:Uncharacterized protein n=1 Tax=Cacopsylla melanoneura TaxID=428564 RepID=A0A8D9AKS5_9HEMI